MTHRVAVALVVGVVCGIGSFLATELPGFLTQDFSVWWLGAKAVLHGQSPYTTIVDPQGRVGFFYPYTAALAAIPFAWLPLTAAGPLFLGGSCALLAYLVTADAWWPLLMFFSGSMVSSIIAAQSAPLITAGLLAPWLTWIGGFKPNIGLAMLAYRPSWKIAATMLVIALASLVVRPAWPSEWLANLHASPFHFAPWRTPGGVILLLALTRWRRAEGRLLVALALVPSAPIAYEVLPLFLIPRSKLEMLTLALLSQAVLLITIGVSEQQETATYLARACPSILWLMYVPALALVLRRPNAGRVPSWLEGIAVRLPVWLRGATT
jgi:hypothetical protein